jgi:hypothetical protein
MSYQVNTLRPGSRAGGEGEAGAGGAAGSRDATNRGEVPDARPARPKGAPYREQSSWAQVAVFAAGVAVGALLGAGSALLTAPQSGIETRIALKRRARRARVRAESRWDDLGRELRAATRRSKRSVTRGVTKSRWRAADAFES